MSHSWRESVAPIIADVLKRCEGQTLSEKRKALREAFPYGERAYHPYKIWLDECRIQLGLKKVRQRKGLPRSLATARQYGKGQKELFNDDPGSSPTSESPMVG